MKKIISAIICIMLFLLSSVVVFADNYTFTIEDLYVYFETDTLPSWTEIREAATEPYELPEGDEERELYKKKRALSTTVFNGFQKSSKYNSWKKNIEKYCYYDSEFNELMANGYSEDEESQEYQYNYRKLESARSTFEKAMSQAAIRDVLDTNNAVSQDNVITYQFSRLTNFVIGTVYGFVRNLDKIAVSCMSVQLAAELIYLSVDLLRPILGMEGTIGRRRVRMDKEDNILLSAPRYEYVDDHSTHFRLVGRAARLAVEQEYKISDDMASAIKNDILKCYFSNKITQIILIVLSVAVVQTNLWSELVIWIIGGLTVI